MDELTRLEFYTPEECKELRKGMWTNMIRKLGQGKALLVLRMLKGCDSHLRSEDKKAAKEKHAAEKRLAEEREKKKQEEKKKKAAEEKRLAEEREKKRQEEKKKKAEAAKARQDDEWRGHTKRVMVPLPHKTKTCTHTKADHGILIAPSPPLHPHPSYL